MLDDVDISDRAYEKHMRKASNVLLLCIERARLGEPTRSPAGLAGSVRGGAKGSWYQQDIERLRAMRASGMTVAQMAAELNRSHESVKDAIRRHLRGFDRYGRQIGGGK